MKNKIIVLSVFLNLLLILAACGAGNVGSSLTPNKLRAYVGAMPGFHGHQVKRTTALDVSIVPKLHAQATTSVSFSGSYSGFCSTVDIPASAATILYGAGTLDTIECSTAHYAENGGDNSATAAANGRASALVIGDGSVGPLVAWADSSTATVHAYINRGGQILDTGIVAHLDGKRGQSASTFPVLDGDTVVIVVQSDGTVSRSLQAVLAKE